jgi:Flp pilus assembly protein TadD
MNKKTCPDNFTEAITQAVLALKKEDIETSRVKITGAMELDMDSPQPHNLLGILYEIAGNDDKARKHYRAAYALDPTYKPACRNLERLVAGVWTLKRDYDYGVETSTGGKIDLRRVAL